jgi:uncharacterized membrane protein (GlpM family)
MEFALKVVASLLVGGAYVALITYISEHINPRLAGVLAGLPSTALIGLIFIALTQDQAAALEAVKAMPAGFGFTALLVASYVTLRGRRSITAATTIALCGWVVPMVLLLTFAPRSLTLYTLVFAVCFGIAAYQLEKVAVEKTRRIPITGQDLVVRAMLAGILIAIAIIFAKLSGAFIGGVIATFPVIVMTSMVMLDYKRDKNLMSATAKTIPYGSFGTVAFLIGFNAWVPPLGMFAGTILAYAASVVFAVIALQVRLRLINNKSGAPAA